mmetsp:Transcript_79322/g.137530  ORF Transcript_79322/g.137530 Transcript_79322/m.137530 type:complete len:150 (+) Transcript_79322:73-522(+)
MATSKQLLAALARAGAKKSGLAGISASAVAPISVVSGGRGPLAINFGFERFEAGPSQPTWHLTRRLRDYGHLLHEGVDAAAIVAEHAHSNKGSDVPSSLVMPMTPTQQGGATPVPTLLAWEGGEGKNASAFSVPADYWQTYNDRCGVFQ